MTSQEPVLSAEHLSKVFRSARSRLPPTIAVEDVSFALYPGRSIALVGESGSGKSTIARMLVGLHRPTGGHVRIEGLALPKRLRGKLRLRFRRQVQMIFQDPFASLNPVKTVGHHLLRPLQLYENLSLFERGHRSEELLTAVGLVPPTEFLEKYPHQLSGGQRQRVAFAAALASEPRVLVADEPTSMLDVSIRVGLLNLINDLRRERNLALLFVTHDLASARYVADELLVLYKGQVVEQGPTEQVLREPRHPYTQLLIAAAPSAGDQVRKLPPRPTTVDTGNDGCAFSGRCPLAMEICRRSRPPIVELGAGQWARCYLADPSSAQQVPEVEPGQRTGT